MGVWNPGPGATAGNDTFTGDGSFDTAAGLDGNDTLNGLGGDDTLYGQNGDDVLNGGDGDDFLIGDAGSDTLNGGDGVDQISDYGDGVLNIDAGTGNDFITLGLNAQPTGGTIDGGDGTDILTAWGNFSASTIQNIETLNVNGAYFAATRAAFESFTQITGDSRQNGVGPSPFVALFIVDGGVIDLSDELLATNAVVLGSGSSDDITTGGGNDELDGNTGGDTLRGGAGNDVYYVYAGDIVVEDLNNGNDTILSYETFYGLTSDNVEVLGGASADVSYTLIGNSANNIIIGNNGNDILDGLGGGDQMIGGAGDDILVVDNAGDTVFENANEGNDLVNVLADDYTLNDGAYVESIIGALDTGQILTGNDLANGISSGAGNDILNGGGGDDTLLDSFGIDVFFGGAGADRFVVTAATLQPTETFLGGAPNESGDTLVLWYDGTFDFTDVLLAEIDGVSFEFGSSTLRTMLLGAAQLSGFTANTLISGDVNSDDQIRIDLTGLTLVDLSTWRFQQWNTNGTIDRIVLLGAGVAETIIGSRANDELQGGGGNDTLQGGRGDDVLDGGAGIDTASYSQASIGVIVGLTDFVTYNTVGAGFDILINVENLTGSAFNDVLSGNAGANVLNGGVGNDTLIGGLGADTLTGGVGVDRANFGGPSTASSWHRNVDGSWTVTSADGTDTSIGVEFLHFTDRDVFLDTATRNFYGNGTSDILFRRNDGIMASWEVTGTTINSAAFLPAVGAEWTALGTGDLGGDGRADVVWQRNDGLVFLWTMNGGTVSAANVVTGLGAEWSFLGIGDFNGDLRDDLAWQRNDGAVYIWQMNGPSIQSASPVAGLAAVWDVVGVGDFNGDGRDDFLWRRSDTGQTVVWQMNGATIESSGATSVQAGLEWTVAGVGDTNGDGYDDIILHRASDGMVRVWSMNGLTVSAATNVAAAPPAQWAIQNIGDYNGDGRDDILWQRADGTVYVWLLNGATISGSGALSGVGAEWDIVGGG